MYWRENDDFLTVFQQRFKPSAHAGKETLFYPGSNRGLGNAQKISVESVSSSS
jgi:hypothetical protein